MTTTPLPPPRPETWQTLHALIELQNKTPDGVIFTTVKQLAAIADLTPFVINAGLHRLIVEKHIKQIAIQHPPDMQYTRYWFQPDSTKNYRALDENPYLHLQITLKERY